MKVVVIGGGASGLIAAIKASEYADVTIIDGNNKLGKKILITGNGRCNFWNESINISKYNKEASSFLNEILKSKDEVYDFLIKKLGITPISKDGYIYPYSKTAASVLSSLMNEVKKRNINILYDLKVTSIKIEESYITLTLSDNTTLRVDKVIVATGSKAASKTGSDGSGYELLKNLGIKIDEVTPSLVPLFIRDDVKHFWSGVRANARVSFYKESSLVKEEIGEIQLTENGISGIVTFNISGLVSSYLSSNKDFSVIIDFLPEIDDARSFLDNKSEEMNSNNLEELFETIFNYKLLSGILRRANLKKDDSWNNLNDNEKNILIDAIKRFKVYVVGTDSFDKAQVCHGGVSLDEIDYTFSLKKYNNIKVVGEILNVDGDCGGYNLAFAFISGYIGGSSIHD